MTPILKAGSSVPTHKFISVVLLTAKRNASNNSTNKYKKSYKSKKAFHGLNLLPI